MPDFTGFEWVSFDCYGTLVDWETGISSAVADVLKPHGVRKSRAEVLELFSDVEPRVQSSQDYLEYRLILRRVMEAIGIELGVRLTEVDLGCLGDTLPDWPVFPDVVDALNALKARYKPSLRNFDAAAARMAVEKERWLHVAESLYHDVAPANRLGIKSVWVNRADRGGGTRHIDAAPDLVVPDLGELARTMWAP